MFDCQQELFSLFAEALLYVIAILQASSYPRPQQDDCLWRLTSISSTLQSFHSATVLCFLNFRLLSGSISLAPYGANLIHLSGTRK